MEVLKKMFSNQYFIVVLVVLMMIVLVIVSYLIKLQASSKTNAELEKDSKEDMFELSSNNTFNSDSLSNSNDSFAEVEKPIVKLEIEKEEISDIFNMESIDSFENDEEETAIISAEELKQATENRASTLGIGSNEDLINYYETEQEKKAIISYEELLNNASKLKVNYVEQKQEKDAPVVRKVEVEGYKTVSYEENEEFLKLLKEFCLNIK